LKFDLEAANLGSYEYELATPPDVPRHRELWLQHAIGFMLFEDMRKFAIERIDPDLSTEARAAAEKAIYDTIYGLMMVIDGVSGWLSSPTHRVRMQFVAQLLNQSDDIEFQLDLEKSDGFCMGFHGWNEGDFGRDVVATRKQP